MKKLILASNSPAKKETLEKLGIEFEVIPSNYEEDHNLDLEPRALVKFLSQEKAKEVAGRIEDGLVIGADTMVLIDGEIMGKAHTEERAREMLRKLSGKKHDVITGLTIIDAENQKKITKCIESRVYFRDLSDEEIDYYVKMENPLHCAGAYQIQNLGQLFVERTEGDISNVIGFPLVEFINILREFGVNIEDGF